MSGQRDIVSNSHPIVTRGSTIDVIDELQPITLAELEAEASMLTRSDRKYLVPVEDVGRVLAPLADGLRVLEIDGRREFTYETVYFDTDDRRSYLDAARRRPQRFKVRTRTYVDAGLAKLEVKLRDGRRRTVKHRHPHDPLRPAELDDDALRFVRGFDPVAPHVDRLHPMLQTRYRRSALVTRDGRATIDVGLEARDLRTDARAVATPMAIVETKTSGAPGDLDRALWRLGHRPLKVSKFGTSLAALHPELPAHKWQRALRRLYPDRSGARDGLG